MLVTWIWATAVLCVAAILYAYGRFRDSFHPLIYLMGMCAFIYVYMPLRMIWDNSLYAFITEEQGVFVQQIVFACLAAMIVGCLIGSESSVVPKPESYFAVPD